jgi:hypothetical protein
MALTTATQAQIALKHLLGKAQTDTSSKGPNNEAEALNLISTADKVWTDTIPGTAPSTSSSVVEVFDGSGNPGTYGRAILVLDPTSNGRAYFTLYPSDHPSYTGSDLASGTRIRNLISTRFGVTYEPIPYDSSTLIPPGDSREWIYQFEPGIFFQENVVAATPDTIKVYAYIGETVADQTFAGSSGWSGFSGSSGISGNSGVSGTSGYSGVSGTSGYSGVSGTSGSSGTTGASGNSGHSGSSGISGSSGRSGVSGYSGYSGVSGTSGSSGTTGTSGVSGTSGYSGVGTSGTSGQSGASTSGVSGYSGVSGTSGTSGNSGHSGTSGTSGYSGYSPCPSYYEVTIAGNSAAGIIPRYKRDRP